VVPREDKANYARVKRMKERAVPVRHVVLDLCSASFRVSV
jgi:hypothetical protein